MSLLFEPPPPGHHDAIFSPLFSSTTPSAIYSFRHSQTTALSNQDLYELVQDAHHGAIQFSTLKQAVQPLVRVLETDYSTAIKSYQNDSLNWSVATGAIAAVAILFWWNPAGWAVLGGAVGGAAAGGAAGCIAHSQLDAKRGEAFGKKDRVRECKVSFPLMFPALTIG